MALKDDRLALREAGSYTQTGGIPAGFVWYNQRVRRPLKKEFV